MDIRKIILGFIGFITVQLVFFMGMLRMVGKGW